MLMRLINASPHRFMAGLPSSGTSSANSGGNPRDAIAQASQVGWSSSPPRSMETTDTANRRERRNQQSQKEKEQRTIVVEVM
jgi:hypothetical protein